MTYSHTKESFKSLLNTKFKVTFDTENKYDVELIKIIEGEEIPSLDLQPFTLVFRGGRNEKIFIQGLYDVSSEALGDMALFLIPRRPDDDGIYYDVIFN